MYRGRRGQNRARLGWPSDMYDPIVTYSTAKGYVQSAYLMMTSPYRYHLPNDTPFYLSFHMLCGFAVELYLKAYLSHKGFTDRQLRQQKFRHDLRRLHDLAAAEGLLDGGSSKLAIFLGEHHNSFEFRYMKPKSYFWAMNLRDMFAEFSSLDYAIDDATGASASRNRRPGSGWIFPSEHAHWRFPNMVQFQDT